MKATCSTCGERDDCDRWRYCVSIVGNERTRVWRCNDCDFARSTNLSTAKAIDNTRTTIAQRKHARSAKRGGEAARPIKSIDAAVKRGDL